MVSGAWRARAPALDDLVLDSVTRFDVVVEYGPRERLLVLPEESVDGLREGASRLCALAGDRLGRHVRMALAGFPAHGSSLRELLTELEIDLATCLMRGITVQACGTAPMTPSSRSPSPPGPPHKIRTPPAPGDDQDEGAAPDGAPSHPDPPPRVGREWDRGYSSTVTGIARTSG
jgi:hypothetical protein